MPIASVVADANVLLSAVAGKAALRVFTEFGLTVHVAEFTADEVVEYLPYIGILNEKCHRMAASRGTIYGQVSATD